jgi:hypothetical protein
VKIHNDIISAPDAQSTLTLLVARIIADHPNHAAAPDYFALAADLLDRRLHSHLALPTDGHCALAASLCSYRARCARYPNDRAATLHPFFPDWRR